MGATGSGSTIVAVGTTFAGRVMKIGSWNLSIPVLDDTALDTTGYEEYCFGELVKHDGIEIEVLSDSADDTLPILGEIKTWTLTMPSGKTIAGTGGISAVQSSELEAGVRRKYQFTLQFDGKELSTSQPTEA